MKTESDAEGHCAICGNFEKLTFEHVPPKSAFNNRPTFVQKYDHLVDKTSYLFGKMNRSPKGFGGYTLCSSCNNLTGSWYGEDFGVFAHQGAKVLKSFSEPQYFIYAEYKIKPLNVLKQILSMFMSADKGGSLQEPGEIRDFILDKNSNILPERYKVYLYSSFGPKRRMLGYSIVGDFDKNEIYKWSEINFPPFGYFLTEDSPAPHTDMQDITAFKQYKYNEEVIIRLLTPYLIVSTPEIGIYD